MCGIHAIFSPTPSQPSHNHAHDLPPDLKRRLRARGPDHFGQVERRISVPVSGDDDTVSAAAAPSRSCWWSLRLTSTVLALRGDHAALQPLVDDDDDDDDGDNDRHGSDGGSVLCWNGEAWRLGGQTVPPGENDGEVVLRRLVQARRRGEAEDGQCEDKMLGVIRGIEGPFAMVFWDAQAATLFFARDRLGRRSLVARDAGGGGLELCSVAGADGGRDGWREVEADGIYAARVGAAGRGVEVVRYEWVVGGDADEFVSGIGRFNKALPDDTCALMASTPSVVMLRQQLLESLRLRILDIPPPPPASVDGKTRVAVLFSGGLDCTVLVRLSHEVLDADQGIDLINVAFENPRVVAQLKKESKGNLPDFYEACPDRITGRRSFAELQRVCPGRALRFVAVNIPYAETQAHRQEVVSLIHPHNTEMDLSISYALYFAARGEGLCTESSNPKSPPAPYTSPARVLLSGLGADELFGGYSRHPSAFQQRGYAGLIDELLLDVRRLGKRNLGRDDRVMAHWGKEVRFPYLDERLVRWAIETPVWEKCDFENGEEATGVEAGKRVLRLLAMQLGMEGVAREKKRAIQFGSRTAKMESGRVKGTTLIS